MLRLSITREPRFKDAAVSLSVSALAAAAESSIMESLMESSRLERFSLSSTSERTDRMYFCFISSSRICAARESASSFA